ncbi:ABC transporter permease [Microlunatus ginsengisoli]|uniref:ABC transport system permease protein n=1 Tax=Microlunatus ginsengisoli TaxID=363863 RepID=A0ABP7AJR2_9ACTN
MIRLWLAGLLTSRRGQLAGVAAGIAIAVALLATLGAFLVTARSTMTARALQSVVVSWQVEVHPGSDPTGVVDQVRAAPGVTAAVPVEFAPTTRFTARTAGSTQTTGAGVIVALPPHYRQTFPGQIRTLAGADVGVLLAQQTAANLRARPGDQIRIDSAGRSITVTVDGVVDLPQADSLFQKVGAAPQAQPTAPPDNVVLIPERMLTRELPNAAVTTQIHVARQPPAQPAPADAYRAILAAAHNLEAKLAGSGVVGNNMGAALDAARSDAAYAQLLFLFLGVPGVILAVLITAALVAAGAPRRRSEQALLRTRGLTAAQIVRLSLVEALTVGTIGGLVGIGLAAVASRAAFGAATFTVDPAATAAWFIGAAITGLLAATAVAMVPTAADLRQATVTSTQRRYAPAKRPRWERFGVDLILLAAALAVFAAAGTNTYTLVVAPEGVPTIAVSYWAALAPLFLWVGGAMLLWRLSVAVLSRSGRPLTAMLAPFTGRLARPGAAALTRQRRLLARCIVLLALAVSFAATVAVFNATYRQQAEADAQLTNGADVTVSPAPGAHFGPDRADDLSTVPGVVHVEPVQHRYAYVGADLQDLYGVRPDTVGRVTTLQDAYFTGGTAQQLMAILQARPDAILVSAETVTDFQLAPGDLLNLRLQDSSTKKLRTVPFHYAGIVNEFPTAPKDSFFVANADYISQQTGSNAVGAFLIDTGGLNQPAIASALRNQLGTAAAVTDITQVRSRVGSSLTAVDLAGLTKIELAFGALLATAAGGLVLLIGLAERRRTLAILALLGARRGQLRGLVGAESAIVAAGGILGGTMIAICLSIMLIKVLTGVFDPPPSAAAVPIGYLAATLSAVLAGLTVAALVGARASLRPAVEELRDL